MTTVELAEATRSEVERLRSAIQDHGLTADQVRSALHDHGLSAEQVRSALREHGLSGEQLQERVAAATDRGGSGFVGRIAAAARRRSARAVEARRRLPRGVRIGMRALGLAWAGLMVSTLTMALVSRTSSRRVPALDPDANVIRLRADLGPMAFTSRAKAFKGGAVDCWYGGGFIDLREATLDPAGAHLRVRVVFGGGQIVVPDSWRVVRRVRGIGGMTDLRPSLERDAEAPVLTIDGVALFGGFSVESSIESKTRANLEKAVAAMGGVEGEPAAPEAATNGHGPAASFAASEMDVLTPV